MPPASTILAAQKRDGWWGKTRDYYIPKHYSTFWALTVLADLGLTAENECVRRGCEFMFDHQRESGAFCRRRRVAGQGIVWDEEPGPCTHARILRFLTQFGYSNDPRVKAGLDWLLAKQRADGMWMCGRRDVRRGCLRATLDFLRRWPTGRIQDYLLGLPGVGPKTAACVLLFALRKPVFPVDTLTMSYFGDVRLLSP